MQPGRKQPKSKGVVYLHSDKSAQGGPRFFQPDPTPTSFVKIHRQPKTTPVSTTPLSKECEDRKIFHEAKLVCLLEWCKFQKTHEPINVEKLEAACLQLLNLEEEQIFYGEKFHIASYLYISFSMLHYMARTQGEGAQAHRYLDCLRDWETKANESYLWELGNNPDGRLAHEISYDYKKGAFNSYYKNSVDNPFDAPRSHCNYQPRQ